MSRSELRRIYRNEVKRHPQLTWAEYLHRYEVARKARALLIEGPTE